MASTVFQTWPCQTWPCQLPAGANVVASPKIPSLPAHWYAATSVKPTAPSKTSAETTGNLLQPADYASKSVDSTTAGKFKLRSDITATLDYASYRQGLAILQRMAPVGRAHTSAAPSHEYLL
jgi:hypothetical protein